MGNPMPADEDKRLEILFRGAAAPVADGGFSDAVMRRLSRHVWGRRLLVAGAAGVGVALALQPAWKVSVALGHTLGNLAGRWPEFAGVLEGGPALIVAGVVVLLAPGVLQWLEE